MKCCLLAVTGLLALDALAAPTAGAEPPSPPGKTITIRVPPQAWETRRSGVAKVFNTLGESAGADKAALARLDKVLTGYEKDLVSITPMEAMDLQLAFYVPQDLLKNTRATLAIVAMHAALGWYDALRYADESGRAEILNNEQFFHRAFSDESSRMFLVNYLKKQPKEAAEAVQTGLRMARDFRGRTHYDEQWPTAYGLKRTQCAIEGKKNCPKPTPMPKAEWDAAFAEAQARVEHYYRNNE